MMIKRIFSAERHMVIGLFDQYRIFYGQPSDRQLAGDFIRQRLENNESIILVAVEQQNGDEVPVGFTQLYPSYSSVRAVRNWILNDLYVAPEYRKKGIGEKLIRAAMQFAREQQAKFVQLETAMDNCTAQRLYESIGFVKQQPDPDFFVYRIGVDL